MITKTFQESGLAFQSPEVISARRNEIFLHHVAYLAARSPFYQHKFAKEKIDIRDIKTIDDLPGLPLTDKADLAGAADEFLCVPPEQVVDFCLTSGTTGAPVPLQQTAADLQRLAFNEEISFRGAGIASGDRVLIAVALDRCFMAGLAYFLGLLRIGALAIRGGSGSLPVLAELARRYRPTAIIGVPTLLLRLAERLAGSGNDPTAMGVKRLICIGEPVRDRGLALSALGDRLANLWQASLYGTYASTEMATSFSDCCAGRGGHVPAELVAVEILDDKGRPLPAGEAGEVVATPFQVTGMPLLRFRTGDIAVFHEDPCPCGRRTPRLGPVLGRLSQMLKVRGTTFFPQSIFSVLEEVEEVRGYYLEVFDEFDLSDRVRVVVGATDGTLDAKALGDRLAASLRVRPEVLVLPPEEVQLKTHSAEKRKPMTFFDYRRQTLSGR